MSDEPMYRPAISDDWFDPDSVILRGDAPCMFCGLPVGGHDDAACNAKLAAWRPTGLLGRDAPAP